MKNVRHSISTKIRNRVERTTDNISNSNNHSLDLNVISCLPNTIKPDLKEARSVVMFIHYFKCKPCIIDKQTRDGLNMNELILRNSHFLNLACNDRDNRFKELVYLTNLSLKQCI